MNKKILTGKVKTHLYSIHKRYCLFFLKDKIYVLCLLKNYMHTQNRYIQVLKICEIFQTKSLSTIPSNDFLSWLGWENLENEVTEHYWLSKFHIIQCCLELLLFYQPPIIQCYPVYGFFHYIPMRNGNTRFINREQNWRGNQMLKIRI